MKVWIGLALVALVVPGGSIALLIHWRRRWVARARAQVDQAIAAQREGLYYTYTEANETLSVQARLRRDIADRKRRQAAAVNSGSSSSDVLKMVNRS